MRDRWCQFLWHPGRTDVAVDSAKQEASGGFSVEEDTL